MGWSDRGSIWHRLPGLEQGCCLSYMSQEETNGVGTRWSRLLMVPCMYHTSNVISFQERRYRVITSSSATFGLRPNVFLSTVLIVSRKRILYRLLDLFNRKGIRHKTLPIYGMLELGAVATHSLTIRGRRNFDVDFDLARAYIWLFRFEAIKNLSSRSSPSPATTNFETEAENSLMSWRLKLEKLSVQLDLQHNRTRTRKWQQRKYSSLTLTKLKFFS